MRDEVCVHICCHFYIIGFLFFSVAILKIYARHKWKFILRFDWIQIAHIMNVRFTRSPGHRLVFSPHLPFSLILVSMETKNVTCHINSGLRSCHGDYVFVSVCLSLVPLPYQPQFDCCTGTQQTLRRAAQASFTHPLEGALQGKLHRKTWVWFYWYVLPESIQF